jgi:5'-3' exonuclease
MKKIYLVDSSIYIFRAWFSMDDSIVDSKGKPVNALYGFANFLIQLLEREKPQHIAAVFDESLTSSFRNEIYPEYKANRDPAPPELKHQFGLCRALCRSAGIPEFASDRYEADDLIGSLASMMRKQGYQVTIVSRDKDLVQLLEQDDHLWDFADNRRFNLASAEKHFGVRPDQIIDYLALAGDAVDNIPGVPGVGKKTAQTLLQHFNDMDDLYENLDRVLDISMRGAKRAHSLLDEHREQAYLSRELTRIVCDVDLGLAPCDLEWSPVAGEVMKYFRQLGVGERVGGRFERLIG